MSITQTISRYSRNTVIGVSLLALTSCAGNGMGGLGMSNSGCGGNKEMFGTLAGAALGLWAGTNVGKGDGRTGAIALGTLLGAGLGKTIGAALDCQDQQRMAQATAQAFETGAPVAWNNPDKPVGGRVSVQPAPSRRQTSHVKVLQEVETVPVLTAVSNHLYVATTDVNLRSGPGTNYTKLAGLRTGQQITVKGKVRGASWYMVERDSVGEGYVHADYIKPWTGGEVKLAQAPVAAPSAVKTVPVSGDVACKTVTQQISTSGQQQSESYELCERPDGTFFSPT